MTELPGKIDRPIHITFLGAGSMLDPLTAVILTPREIRQMAIEMSEVDREFLPGFR